VVYFGIGWFLSALFLMFVAMLTDRIEDKDIANALQTGLVVVWLVIGATAVIFN
jgi:hypothetical protein